MNRRPRKAATALTKCDIPDDPGVYAWYRDERPVYVGETGSLQTRIWKRHLGRGRVMSGSALRRDVAARLGISTPALIKRGGYQPAPDELRAIRAFIEECDVAWLVKTSKEEAVDLEKRMRREWLPPLNRL